jgi:hypothetical protein
MSRPNGNKKSNVACEVKQRMFPSALAALLNRTSGFERLVFSLCAGLYPASDYKSTTACDYVNKLTR